MLLIVLEEQDIVSGLGKTSLWVSDGTQANTRVLLQSTADELYRAISDFRELNGEVYFTTGTSYGDTASSLWKTDGTQSGTRQISGGQLDQSVSAFRILGTVADTLVYLTREPSSSDIILWSTKGSMETTTRLHAISLGAIRNVSAGFKRDNGLCFLANDQLWYTDGTINGTSAVAGHEGLLFNGIATVGDVLLLVGDETEVGTEIWRSDGTVQGTALLKDAFPGKNSGVQYGDFLHQKDIEQKPPFFLFGADNGIDGNGIWITDGDASHTKRLMDLSTGTKDADPSGLIEHNGDLFFVTNRFAERRGQSRMWAARGSVGAISLGKGDGYRKAGDHLYFTGDQYETDVARSLWQRDGDNVRKVPIDVSVFSPLDMVELGTTRLVLGFEEPGSDFPEAVIRRVFDDGTTSVVKRLESYASSFLVINDQLACFFDEQGNLWRTDGTTEGTFAIPGLRYENETLIGNLVALNEMVVAPTFGGFFLTDGSVSGSKRFTDLSPELSYAVGLNTLRGSYFFGSTLGLYKTDGSNGGTQLVRPGLFVTDSKAAVVGKFIYFWATERTDFSHVALWRSDGTAAGTTEVAAFADSFSPNQQVTDFTAVGSKLFFNVWSDASQSRAIWISDGTASGTVPLRHTLGTKLQPGTSSQFTLYSGGIGFVGDTEETGTEVFRIDTTTPVASPIGLELVTRDASSVGWTDVAGAMQYDVSVQNLSNPAAPAIRKRVNDPEILLQESSGANIAGDLQTSAYRMWVRSLPVLGEPSAWSQPLDFATGPTPLMHSVVASSTNRTPTFQWAGSAGTVSYDLWVDNNDAKTRPISQQGLTKTSFAVTTPLDPARYSAKVRGTRADGTKTEWSPVSNFTIFAAPIALTSGGGESLSGQPSLAWAAVPGATGYDVQITAAGSNSILYRANNVQGTAHALKNGLAAGQYKVYVRANKGSQPLSTWGSGNDLQVKLPPTGLVRTGTGIAGNVGVKWNAVPLAVSYTIELINTFTGNKVQADQTQTTTTLNPSPALLAGQYSVRVRSNFATGAASNWSPAFAFDALRSAAVTITSSSAATADATPTITWTASPGATGYEIFVSRQGSSAAVYTRSGITTTSHRVDVPLTSAMHRIWVRPTFADGSRGIWGAGQQLQIGPAPVITRTSTGFSWTAINAATQYEFWLSSVDPTAGVKRVLYDAKLVTTSYTLPTTFPKGRYQLWVRAIRSEAGASYLGNWGTTGTFDLT